MQLTKDRILFQVKYKNRELPEKSIYSLRALKGKFGNRERDDIEVIECQVVEVGVIPYNEIVTPRGRR